MDQLEKRLLWRQTKSNIVILPKVVNVENGYGTIQFQDGNYLNFQIGFVLHTFPIEIDQGANRM